MFVLEKLHFLPCRQAFPSQKDKKNGDNTIVKRCSGWRSNQLQLCQQLQPYRVLYISSCYRAQISCSLRSPGTDGAPCSHLLPAWPRSAEGTSRGHRGDTAGTPPPSAGCGRVNPTTKTWRRVLRMEAIGGWQQSWRRGSWRTAIELPLLM